MSKEQSTFFRLNVLGQNWGQIEERSKLIFVDRPDASIFSQQDFPDVIFSFAANYDLKAMEAYLSKNGFENFNMNGIPATILGGLTIKQVNLDKHRGKARLKYSPDEALALIEKRLSSDSSKGGYGH